MSSSEHKTSEAAGKFTIPPSHPWANLWKIFAGVSVLGLGLSGAGIGMGGDIKRFAFVYLAAFAWGLTMALGGLFFVLVQHMTNAGWSVVVRRGAEQLMATLPVFALLFVPIVIFRESLYPWLGHEAHDPAVHAKAGFLNLGFWLVRAVIYFGVWTVISQRLLGLSTEQDKTRATALTLKMVSTSAVGLPLFALTLTFAGFDWYMSLEPKWYSTMFGVYFFAGSVLSMFAFMNLLFTRMRASGLLPQVTNEHFHDLGKFMFAFTIFLAYIGFSQYMLYWYANIPEETLFFKHRQEHGWGWVSILLILGHFFFPFFLMLSVHAKRSDTVRTIGAVWLLFMHFVDMYWLVVPNVAEEFHFEPLLDLGSWFFIGGAMFAVLFRRMLSSPIIPVGDPRLGRSLRFENA
jgi:hypothetical protein